MTKYARKTRGKIVPSVAGSFVSKVQYKNTIEKIHSVEKIHHNGSSVAGSLVRKVQYKNTVEKIQ